MRPCAQEFLSMPVVCRRSTSGSGIERNPRSRFHSMPLDPLARTLYDDSRSCAQHVFAIARWITNGIHMATSISIRPVGPIRVCACQHP